MPLRRTARARDPAGRRNMTEHVSAHRVEGVRNSMRRGAHAKRMAKRKHFVGERSPVTKSPLGQACERRGLRLRPSRVLARPDDILAARALEHLKRRRAAPAGADAANGWQRVAALRGGERGLERRSLRSEVLRRRVGALSRRVSHF